MARVIGVDFGNWNAFTCFVENMNEETRMGGRIVDLVPDRYRELGKNGIPNEFFWAKKGPNGEEKEFYGFEAAKDTNNPAENHRRLLKRNIGRRIKLYGDKEKTNSREFAYDDLIVNAFSYIVRLANESLRDTYGEAATTNLISVTYPASLNNPSSLRYFVDLAERADSGARDKNGKMLKIKVVGATCEPAAAGLDRLSEQRETSLKEVETFGVCDFGGGTYDLSIVSLYPKGRKYADNTTYYFDIVCDGEGLNVGGSDFTEILEKLYNDKLRKAIGRELSDGNKRVTRRNTERCKLELSTAPDAVIYYEVDGDDVEIRVNRNEFEKAIALKVKEVVDYTKKFFADHRAQKPENIIMTGGTFFIPYVEEQLKKALPEFAGRIHRHKPSKAAAHGAARFYNPIPPVAPRLYDGYVKPNPVKSNVVRKTLSYDITTKIEHNGVIQMTTLLKKGTEIPCSTGECSFSSVHKGAISTDYNIYIANKNNPDVMKIVEDYDCIQAAVLNHPNEPANEHVVTCCNLIVDDRGILSLKAWTKNNPNIEINYNDIIIEKNKGITVSEI